MFKAYKEMPILLRHITLSSLGCIVFLVVIVVPGMPIDFMGTKIESRDLWQLGLGLPIVSVGLLMPIVGLLLLKRWRYSRHVFTFMFISAMVMPYIYWQQLALALFGLVLSCVVIGYLFSNEKVKEYFRF